MQSQFAYDFSNAGDNVGDSAPGSGVAVRPGRSAWRSGSGLASQLRSASAMGSDEAFGVLLGFAAGFSSTFDSGAPWLFFFDEEDFVLDAVGELVELAFAPLP